MKQLKEQKRKLAGRSLQTEKNIRLHWNSLKESLELRTLAADAIDKIAQHKRDENGAEGNVLKSTFMYGVTLFAQKFAEKAEEKMKKFFRK